MSDIKYIAIHHAGSSMLELIVDYHKSFAIFLKAKRIKKGISQRELAKETGISNTSISRYESGIKKNPNIKSLIKLGIVLEFTLDDIQQYF